MQDKRGAVAAGHGQWAATEEAGVQGSPLPGASPTPVSPPYPLRSPSLVTHIRDSGTQMQEKDVGKCRQQRRASIRHPVRHPRCSGVSGGHKGSVCGAHRGGRQLSRCLGMNTWRRATCRSRGSAPGIWVRA